VSDRDFVLEVLFASSVLMMHLSRLSEELVIWATRSLILFFFPTLFAPGAASCPRKRTRI